MEKSLSVFTSVRLRTFDLNLLGKPLICEFMQPVFSKFKSRYNQQSMAYR